MPQPQDKFTEEGKRKTWAKSGPAGYWLRGDTFMTSAPGGGERLVEKRMKLERLCEFSTVDLDQMWTREEGSKILKILQTSYKYRP